MDKLKEIRFNPEFIKLETQIKLTSEFLDHLIKEANEKFAGEDLYFWLNAAHTLSVSHRETERSEEVW